MDLIVYYPNKPEVQRVVFLGSSYIVA